MPSSTTELFPRVLELAARGRYGTSPNPRVGALVLDAAGKVVGEGFHQRAGGPHAERVALDVAGERARGGTVLVNLEPCAHHGRTPPCADALVAAGVARVVISVLDPDPRTSGRGVARLREAGVDVEIGAFGPEAERLNEIFLTSVRRRRPFVHLKWAASLDGKIATRTGHSRWVSSEESRAEGMRLREETDVILAGARTILLDDPLLTRRAGLSTSILPHRRVVLDGALRVPASARVFDTSETETWLVTARPLDDPDLAPFRSRGVRTLSLPEVDERGNGSRVDLHALLAELATLEVRSMLVEGGGETAWSFLRSDLVDRLTTFVAPILIGGRDAPSPLSGDGFESLAEAAELVDVETSRSGRDLMVTGRVLPKG